MKRDYRILLPPHPKLVLKKDDLFAARGLALLRRGLILNFVGIVGAVFLAFSYPVARIKGQLSAFIAG